MKSLNMSNLNQQELLDKINENARKGEIHAKRINI